MIGAIPGRSNETAAGRSECADAFRQIVFQTFEGGRGIVAQAFEPSARLGFARSMSKEVAVFLGLASSILAL